MNTGKKRNTMSMPSIPPRLRYVMTDKELLELAAKAAGTELERVGDGGSIYYWNPLTDDGDALRLLVTLHLSLDLVLASYFDEDIGNDPYAATRRAIVRAAAEIGKGM